MPRLSPHKNLLLIGASRGLVRTTSQLDSLLGVSDGRLEIETVDIVYPDQVAALRARLASRKFDMLLVNAGVKNDDRETLRAGCARIWAERRRDSASKRAYRTLRRPWTRRPGKQVCTIWITWAERFRGECLGRADIMPA